MFRSHLLKERSVLFEIGALRLPPPIPNGFNPARNRRRFSFGHPVYTFFFRALSSCSLEREEALASSSRIRERDASSNFSSSPVSNEGVPKISLFFHLRTKGGRATSRAAFPPNQFFSPLPPVRAIGQRPEAARPEVTCPPTSLFTLVFFPRPQGHRPSYPPSSPMDSLPVTLKAILACFLFFVERDFFFFLFPHSFERER